jgi:hypothetical protein
MAKCSGKAHGVRAPSGLRVTRMRGGECDGDPRRANRGRPLEGRVGPQGIAGPITVLPCVSLSVYGVLAPVGRALERLT